MITGIVLAGGTSRRFGSNKLAAELAGTTLLASAIASVERVADAVIVAGPSLPLGFRRGKVPVAVVPDPAPSAGPLVALGHALATQFQRDPGEELAIVVGGDMPRLVPAVLAAMLDRLATESALDAVLLEAPGMPHTQILPVALRVEPAARAATIVLELGDRSLRALIDRLVSAELPAATWRALDPSGASLADVDRPEDLDRIRADASERRTP